MDIIESKTWVEWLITIAKFGFCFVPVLYILLLIPMERRGAGFMQDRQGPNRSYIKIPFFGKIRLLGYVQNMCDGTKLFFKEMFAPAGVNKVLYYLLYYKSLKYHFLCEKIMSFELTFVL